MIRSYILNNSGNIMDAEDVFQDALMAIHLKPELILTCQFKTYLFEVCKRQWLTHLNSRHEIDYIEDEHDERIDLVMTAFDKLSKKKKQVLTLALNMPLSEVAEIMGCTYKSVKVKKYKALKQLRLLTNDKLSCKFVPN